MCRPTSQKAPPKTGDGGNEQLSDRALELPSESIARTCYEGIRNVLTIGFRNATRVRSCNDAAAISHAGKVLIEIKRSEPANHVFRWKIIGEHDYDSFRHEFSW